MLIFTIMCLAAYRITHLIVFDKIFDPIRRWFVTRDFTGEQPTYTLRGGPLRRTIGKIMNCFWCAGIWVSAAVWTAHHFVAGYVEWMMEILAVAAVLSLIETAWCKVVGMPEMWEKQR